MLGSGQRHALKQFMNRGIEKGTILIRGDALLPRSMKIESDPYVNDWRRASEGGVALDRQVIAAKWNFFYLAGEIKANAFGSEEGAMRRAVSSILGGLTLGPYNCLEITNTKISRVLGLFFVSVTAHTRHIQEGNQLLEPLWSRKN